MGANEHTMFIVNSRRPPGDDEPDVPPPTGDADQHLTLSVEEAARMLGISRGLAYTLVNRGEIPSVRLGRRIVVPRRSLDRLLDVPDDAA